MELAADRNPQAEKPFCTGTKSQISTSVYQMAFPEHEIKDKKPSVAANWLAGLKAQTGFLPGLLAQGVLRPFPKSEQTQREQATGQKVKVIQADFTKNSVYENIEKGLQGLEIGVLVSQRCDGTSAAATACVCLLVVG
ncbi:Testosterone 17-beta-dehydrogenase 3 [Anas platyrhynchos]|uniref:Testosterone 17-beta-dehydrogenase 3 n=1 Tax=Anas platyrhynchos TaxID=8839 RepID=R0LH26_ANAPL|nr:Testosterone 17-beta-dehydrogenase 3 [Anas platyrhynchos]